MQIPSAEWAGSEPPDGLGAGQDGVGVGDGDGGGAAAACWAARSRASLWVRATRRAERAWARPTSRRISAVTWPPVKSASSLAAETARPEDVGAADPPCRDTKVAATPASATAATAGALNLVAGALVLGLA